MRSKRAPKTVLLVASKPRLALLVNFAKASSTQPLGDRSLGRTVATSDHRRAATSVAAKQSPPMAFPSRGRYSFSVIAPGGSDPPPQVAIRLDFSSREYFLRHPRALGPPGNRNQRASNRFQKNPVSAIAPVKPFQLPEIDAIQKDSVDIPRPQIHPKWPAGQAPRSCRLSGDPWLTPAAICPISAGSAVARRRVNILQRGQKQHGDVEMLSDPCDGIGGER